MGNSIFALALIAAAISVGLCTALRMRQVKLPPALTIVANGHATLLTLAVVGAIPTKSSTDGKGGPFSGPTLRSVLQAAKVEAFTELVITAFDGFTAVLPSAMVTEDVIIGLNRSEFVQIVGPSLKGEQSPKQPRRILVK